MIDSECAGIVPENEDVSQENSAALHVTFGIRGRCISLDGAPVRMCTRKLQAVTGKRSSMQWIASITYPERHLAFELRTKYSSLHIAP